MSITVDVKLTEISCGCGGVYAIAESHRTKMHQEGGCWTCPYCQCSWGFANKGENARLKRELEESRVHRNNEIARHDQTKAELRETELRRRAEKGAKTRIKNRVANGVCPCCNRSFVNLARHMHNQHPAFGAGGGST